MYCKKIHIVMAAALLMTAVSCKKDKVTPDFVDRTFESSLEKPDVNNDQTGDDFDPYAKNYLSMERYVNWEPTDTVAVFAGIGDPKNPAPQQVQDIPVTVRSNERFADINCSGIQYADVYYGVFPARSRVGGDPTQINILSSYTYRDDNSFPRPGIPMVAWDGDGSSEAPSLDFNSVCGLVRIQITSEQNATVTAVSLTEIGGEKEYAAQGYSTHPISGLFKVNDIDKDEPYVTPQNKESQTKIRFYDVNQPIGSDKLLTFYFPLPATQPSGIPEDKDATVLGLTVKATLDGKEVNFKKVFRVKIRRNTMSFMRTLTITDWAGSGATQGLVGEGTEVRPFQIYTAGDMEILRDAFLSGNPTINGIPITKNTIFRVVRSNIELTTSNWTAGIPNFVGKFKFQTATDQVGIMNNSNCPIFESIAKDGYVEDVAVKRDGHSTYGGSSSFSPLCNVNSGTINNCHNLSSITSPNSSLAGLCVRNTSDGKILSCSNTGNLTVNGSGHAAGICLKNEGIIECYQLSIAKVNAACAGGICDSNAGIIRNTQVTYSRADVAKPYGGIAYVNLEGGLIDRCQVLGALASSSSIGGICHNNQGVVNFCRNGLSQLRGAGYTGGIAAEQTTLGKAEIRNCFNSSAASANVSCTSGIVGGIVANLNGGKVYNCYCTLEVASTGATEYGAIAGDVRGGDVQNCYNGTSLAEFYGRSSSHPISINCFNPSAYSYCCEFERSTGKIISLTNNSTGSRGGNMYDALNAWVSSHGSNYLSWSSAALPTFTSAK